MPLYLDIHRNVDENATTVADSFAMDLEVQERHDVRYERYWIDEDEGVRFCLFEAPTKAAGEAVHRHAHGRIADEIFEVVEGDLPRGETGR